MAKQTTRVDVVPTNDGGWVAKTRNGRKFASGATKTKVIESAAAKAKKRDRPTSLRIHGRDGSIQEERTYPRSADPKSSKG
jgi:hypothetical protein